MKLYKACHSSYGRNLDLNTHRETALVQTLSSPAAGKRRGDLFFAREIAASATPPCNDTRVLMLDSRLRGNDIGTYLLSSTEVL